MGKHYDQFDLDDRIEISRLHADGISRRAIGRLMGRSASTISRELRRNSLPKGGYKQSVIDPEAGRAELPKPPYCLIDLGVFEIVHNGHPDGLHAQINGRAPDHIVTKRAKGAG